MSPMSYASAVVKRFKPQICKKDIGVSARFCFFVDHTDTSWDERGFSCGGSGDSGEGERESVCVFVCVCVMFHFHLPIEFF